MICFQRWSSQDELSSLQVSFIKRHTSSVAVSSKFTFCGCRTCFESSARGHRFGHVCLTRCLHENLWLVIIFIHRQCQVIDKNILARVDYSLHVAYTNFKFGFQLGFYACRTVVWVLCFKYSCVWSYCIFIHSKMIFITISI